MITICSTDYQIIKPDMDSIMDIIIIDNISFDKLIYKSTNTINITLPEKCHNGMIYTFVNKTPLQARICVSDETKESNIDGTKEILLNWGHTVQMTYYNNNWIIISKYQKNVYNEHTNNYLTKYGLLKNFSL